MKKIFSRDFYNNNWGCFPRISILKINFQRPLDQEHIISRSTRGFMRILKIFENIFFKDPRSRKNCGYLMKKNFFSNKFLAHRYFEKIYLRTFYMRKRAPTEVFLRFYWIFFFLFWKNIFKFTPKGYFFLIFLEDLQSQKHFFLLAKYILNLKIWSQNLQQGRRRFYWSLFYWHTFFTISSFYKN